MKRFLVVCLLFAATVANAQNIFFRPRLGADSLNYGTTVPVGALKDSLTALRNRLGYSNDTTAALRVQINKNIDSLLAHLTRLGKVDDTTAAHRAQITKNMDSLITHRARIQWALDSVTAHRNNITYLYDTTAAHRTWINKNIDSLAALKSRIQWALDSVTAHRNNLTYLYDTTAAHRTWINKNIDSLAALKNRIGWSLDSVLAHRNNLTYLYDTTAAHRTWINKNIDSLAALKTRIQWALDSVTAHRNNLTYLYDTTAAHRTRINSMLDTLGTHLTRLARMDDTLGVHRTAINERIAKADTTLDWVQTTAEANLLYLKNGDSTDRATRTYVGQYTSPLLGAKADTVGNMLRSDSSWNLQAADSTTIKNGVAANYAKKAGYFYPEDYGAVGDSLTDDTTPMQNCLNAAAAAANQAYWTGRGPTVKLGPKIYRCNTLTVPVGVTIEGVLTHPSRYSTILNTFGSDGLQLPPVFSTGIVLRNLRLFAIQAAPDTGWGIMMQDTSTFGARGRGHTAHVTLENVSIQGTDDLTTAWYGGIYATYPDHAWFKNVIVGPVRNDCYYFMGDTIGQGTNTIIFENCRAQNSGGYGWYFLGGFGDVKWLGSSAHFVDGAIKMEGITQRSYLYKAYQVSVNDFFSEYSDTCHFYFKNVYGLKMSGISAVSDTIPLPTGFDENTGKSLYLESVTNANISNFTATYPVKAGGVSIQQVASPFVTYQNVVTRSISIDSATTAKTLILQNVYASLDTSYVSQLPTTTIVGILNISDILGGTTGGAINATDTLRFHSQGTEIARIVPVAGRFLIGTTSSTSPIHFNRPVIVAGDATGINLQLSDDVTDGNNAKGGILFGTGYSKIYSDATGIHLGYYHGTGLTKDFTVNTAGNSIVVNKLGVAGATIDSATTTTSFHATTNALISGSATVGGNLTGNVLIDDSTMFYGTDVRKAKYIAGATATDIYIVTPRSADGLVAPLATDLCGVFAKTDSLILMRSASGTSGLVVNFIRHKKP